MKNLKMEIMPWFGVDNKQTESNLIWLSLDDPLSFFAEDPIKLGEHDVIVVFGEAGVGKTTLMNRINIGENVECFNASNLENMVPSTFTKFMSIPIIKPTTKYIVIDEVTEYDRDVLSAFMDKVIELRDLEDRKIEVVLLTQDPMFTFHKAVYISLS